MYAGFVKLDKKFGYPNLKPFRFFRSSKFTNERPKTTAGEIVTEQV